MGPAADLLNHSLRGWSPGSCVLTSALGTPDAHSGLRNAAVRPAAAWPAHVLIAVDHSRACPSFFQAVGRSHLLGTGLVNITTGPTSIRATPAFLTTYIFLFFFFFCFVGMRKTVHFLEQRISAKSQAEPGLMVPWTECPSDLGGEDVRVRGGVLGGVGK